MKKYFCDSCGQELGHANAGLIEIILLSKTRASVPLRLDAHDGSKADVCHKCLWEALACTFEPMK